MTAPQTAHIMARLRAALEAPDLPAKAAVTGTSLLDRLSNPVRIGVFGFPGMGKRALINSLAGQVIIDPSLPLPTLELVPADQPETHAVLPDGSTVYANGYPGQDITALSPLFLQIKTPAPQMAGRSFLLAAADKSYEDMTAALTWAAPRIDVAIWCSQTWTRFEEDIWRAAPDSLRHHALLVFGDPRALAPPTLPERLAQNGFLSAFDGACGRDLLSHLQDMIDEAATEDLDAAQIFLHRHGVPLAPVPAPCPISRPISRPVAAAAQSRPLQDAFTNSAPDTTAPPRPAPTAQDPDPEALTSLARLFQILRSEATTLHQTLPEAPDDTGVGLGAIERLFEKMANTISTQDTLEETWPELCESICEARDLSLLMRIEGGADQLDDAARLLLQVRQDIEHRLAA